ncbi:hypothetical protein TRFO_36620 [Tritrichomonas foetus]|uniref:Condensin complex subunit 1 C-terminal domain-containing protein n=1 Tax=Tritrichomonas foetus TaxID=1144522 RepID=A0A1J4JDG8_9EUKA|nr:hypothetical protein TRFO_36620 [Tritrichomonas foetus]|eukprot:OHS97202.1 hypothetical protein TRFO_36620 [Tritrichomonas foetus]
MEDAQNLISDIIKKKSDAKIMFLNNIPLLVNGISDENHVELINFILSWCDIENLVNLQVLIDHITDLIPKDSSRSVFLSFLSLFSEIINAAFPLENDRLLNLSSYLVENFGSDFLPRIAFPFLFNTLEQTPFSPSIAFLIRFFSRILSSLDQKNVDYLIAYLKMLSVKNIDVCVKLAIIDSFQYFVEYVQSPETLYESFIRTFLNDKHPIVRSNALKVSSLYPNLAKIDEIMKSADNKSWKVKVAFINSISNLISHQEIEDYLFKLCHSQDFFYREQGLKILSNVYHRIQKKEEISKTIEHCLKVKHEDVVVAALQFLALNKEVIINHKEFYNLLKKSKYRRIKILILIVLTPKIELNDTEIKESAKFTHFLFQSEEMNDIIQCIDIIRENLDYNSDLAFDENVLSDIFLYSTSINQLISKESKHLLSMLEEIKGKEYLNERIKK